MWDNHINPYQNNSMAFVSMQFKYMNFYPENMGSLLHINHRKLSDNASMFYEENKSWINGLAIAFGV